MSARSVLKTINPKTVGYATDVANWGGYSHARLMQRLLRANRPNAAPPDLSQVHNVLLAGTKNVAASILPSAQAAISEFASSSPAHATEASRNGDRVISQLRTIAQLPPIPPDLVWQDMPLGRGLYLIEQPWYRNVPPEFRQVMQALGIERPAIGFSGFSGAPNDPVFDVKLAEELQREAEAASGGRKLGPLTIVAIGVSIGSVLLMGGLGKYFYEKGVALETAIRADDERDRRQVFQSTIKDFYKPMLDLCRRQAEEKVVPIASCLAFVPPLELESNLASFVSGGSCGWANCAQYAGMGAALGLVLGVAAAARFVRRFTT